MVMMVINNNVNINNIANITNNNTLQTIKKVNTNYSIVLILLATLLLSVSSRVVIPIGIVPITAQTLATYVIGFYLKPSESFTAGLSWLVLGISGMPVFSTGFINPLTYPSFGYIVGMILGMPLMKASNNVILSCIICYFITSLFGCCWLYNFVHSWNLVFNCGIYPFIIGECLKIAILVVMKKMGQKSNCISL